MSRARRNRITVVDPHRTMGHADTRILARYRDVVSELQRDAAARMDELLGG
jgi:hypothetical protein